MSNSSPGTAVGQTVGAALADAAARFAAVGIDTPGLDAHALLGHVLGVNRAWLMAHPEALLRPDQADRFAGLVAARAARQPVAYLTGRREFFGLDFTVTPDVLIPRPETEHLVERAVALAEDWHRTCGGWPRMVDVGTGSGAIAVSLAATLPGLPMVEAVDASAAALAVARENAGRHGVSERVRFWQGNLLSPLPHRVDIVLANLPYVETGVIPTLAPDVQREPRLALDGGADGLDVVRRLLAQVPDHVAPGGALLLEIGAGQAQAVAGLAAVLSPAAIHIHRDLAGHDRLVEIRLRDLSD